jgi:ABC-type phosphate transport system auxiliary subunit
MNTNTTGNGGTVELPPAREAVIDQAHRLHQEVAHQRDLLLRREADLMTEIAGLKAQLSVAELTASQLQSKMDSTNGIRDEAVARRAELEAVLRTIQATLRAFGITNEPLIKEVNDEEIASPPAARVSSDIG